MSGTDSTSIPRTGVVCALTEATGADASRRYQEGVVRRHRSAIVASGVELESLTYGPARELAGQVRQAQTAEPTGMHALVFSRQLVRSRSGRHRHGQRHGDTERAHCQGC